MHLIEADVCMQGQGLGTFDDIDQLTMFADYRVPVVLRELGILQYSSDLAFKVCTIEALIHLFNATASKRSGDHQSITHRTRSLLAWL